MTRSRLGKPSVVIASAAASDTPPRMPLHAIATRSGIVVVPWNSTGTTTIHSIRTPITTAVISSA